MPADVEGIVKPCLELATRVVSSCVIRCMYILQIVDVDATIAPNTVSPTRSSFLGDVVDLSGQGYAAEMKKMLSLL